MELHPSEVEQFKQLLVSRLGIGAMEDEPSLIRLLQQRLQATGTRHAAAYLQNLASSREASQELRVLAERLSVGETHFFRTPEQFLAFVGRVLPERWIARGAGRPLKVLSAGCASGEEAYTLAMLVLETGGPLAEAVSIHGIDLNPTLLEKARCGHYSAWSMRGVPATIQRRYFQELGGGFTLAPEVRAQVTFEERNLLDPSDESFWRPGAFDVIFCRNVMIYFSPETIRTMLERFAGSLVPGGYLFLGPSESLRGFASPFALQETHGAFYYQVPLSEARSAQPEARVSQPAHRPPLGAPRAPVPANALPRPAVTPVSPEATSSSAQGLGNALELFRQERFVEAAHALAALSAESPDPTVDLLQAAIALNTGNLAQAEQASREVLAKDEFNAGAYYLLALVQDQAGQQEEAMRTCEIALYHDPRFAMPHLHLALMAKRRGLFSRANLEFRQALALLPGEDDLRIVLFGGGFNRLALERLCRSELTALMSR